MSNKVLKKELLVGAVGIIALLLIYLMINFFKGINLFKDGDTYYVKFNNIGQISSSSPVYLNGFKAGNVQHISYDYDNIENLIVTIEIDKRLRLPGGSYAEINNHMLGGSDISIITGKGEGFITPGDTIKGRLNKGVMGEMGDVVPTINTMIPKIDSILVSLNRILASPALDATIENSAQLTESLKTTTNELNSLLANDIPQITERIVKIEEDILAVSSQLSEADYKKIVASLEGTIANLESITNTLDKGEGTAGKLLKDDALYNKLDSTCEAANALLTDLKKNPKRYVHFSIFGSKKE